jgi:hypothetical protein
MRARASAGWWPRTWSRSASRRTCAWLRSQLPPYLVGRTPPRRLEDHTGHTCITRTCRPQGGLCAWEFEKGGREVRVRVEGQLVFNTVALI